MKKTLLLSTALLALSTPSMAQNYGSPATQQSQAEITQPQDVQQDPVMEQIRYLQTEWARIKYQMPDEDAQIAALEKLGALFRRIEQRSVEIASEERAQPFLLLTLRLGEFLHRNLLPGDLRHVLRCRGTALI